MAQHGSNRRAHSRYGVALIKTNRQLELGTLGTLAGMEQQSLEGIFEAWADFTV